MRKGYLKEFAAGVEAYWGKVGQFTQAYLRSQKDPNIVDLAAARQKRR